MSGRRSHQRFAVTSSAEGTLRILRDVVIEQMTDSDFHVVGRNAAVCGETLTLELADSGVEPLAVEVSDSRPMITDGVVRHRIHLKMSGGR